MKLDKKRRVAVVVARKGSKRLQNKRNCKIYSKIHCQYETLVERKLRQLSEVSDLDEVILGTDDEELRCTAKRYGATFELRDPEFCDEVSSTPNDMIRDMLSKFESDIVLWAHPTNPFITTEHYNHALNMFDFKDSNYDSVASVTVAQNHFFDDDGPLNFNPYDDTWPVAKDVIPLYHLNGGIFIRNYEDMKKDGNFLGVSPKQYILDDITSWDIDYPWQYEIAKLMSENHDKFFDRAEVTTI